MTSWLRGVHRFWFAPEKPSPLPWIRIVVGVYFLWRMLPYDIVRLAEVGRRPLELMDASPIFHLLPMPLPAGMAAYFAAGMVLLGVLFTVGVLTRVALLLFVVGYLYMGAAIGSWAYMPHTRLGLIQTLAVLVVAPGTTQWSLDRAFAWAWARRRGANEALRTVLSGPDVPRWGTQLIVVLFTVLLMSAGLSKLRHSGLRWMDGNTLGFYLGGGATNNIPDARGTGMLTRSAVWKHGYSLLSGPEAVPPAMAWKDGFGIESYYYYATPTRIGRAVARHPSLLVATSIATVLFELAAPLLLFGRLCRALYVFAGLGFFIGIWATMGINFTSWVAVLLCTLDWRWLREQLRAVRTRRRANAPANRALAR